MKSLHRTLVLVVWVISMVGSAAPAQQSSREPHLGYVYPAGGQRGTTVEITVGGQFLDGAYAAHFADPAIRATVVEHVKPLSAREMLLLRDQLRELQEKRSAAGSGGPSTRPSWSGADEKLLAEVRQKLAGFVRRPSSPAIAEYVTLKVTIGPGAKPGRTELRLSARAGLSNPMVFCVGELPEVVTTPVRNAGEPSRSVAREQQAITLPATVNGQVLPGGVDRYSFSARRGQQLVVVVKARELIPYIADAVPGWLQATLALYDDKGRELAYADYYRFDPDPVLIYSIPQSGQYAIEIRDAIYRGREDFVYRIAIGELPFITSVFPLGAPAGTEAVLELNGKNLLANRVTRHLPSQPAGLHPFDVRSGKLQSNALPVAVDTLPEHLESEPNDSAESAQALALPVIFNGRIDRPGDVDVVRVEARAGQMIVAQVQARQLGSPLDSLLRLVDATGATLAMNDDFEDKGAGLATHHADSYVSFQAPADGTYFIHLSDAQQQGGSEYAYRLRLSAPRPDFELRVVPSSVNVRAGSTAKVTVHVLRRDGFDGEVTLGLSAAPDGYRVNGRIPAGQDSAQITLSVPQVPPDGPVPLVLQGQANIEGRKVIRTAVPAQDQMQAFLWRHLVPAEQWLVNVPARGGRAASPADPAGGVKKGKRNAK